MFVWALVDCSSRHLEKRYELAIICQYECSKVQRWYRHIIVNPYLFSDSDLNKSRALGKYKNRRQETATEQNVWEI